MSEERSNAQTEERLTVEEVNIYKTEDCGASRLHCYTDCFIVSPFISMEN